MNRRRIVAALVVVAALTVGVYTFVIDVHMNRGAIPDPVLIHKSAENGTVLVRHTGGGVVGGPGDEVFVTVNGDRGGVVLARNGSVVSRDGTWIARDSDAVVAHDDSIRVRGVERGDTVRVVVQSEEGRRVVGEFTI